MSWLARSIANTLRIDDDGEADHRNDATTSSSSNAKHLQSVNEQNDDAQQEEEEGWDNQGRGGVKEDLSEFRETITRQLWGMASFLAPPPHPSTTWALHHQTDYSVSDRDRRDSSVSGDLSNEDASDSFGNQGLVGDFGDRFGGGISNLSNFRPNRSEDQIRDAVGVTEEVLAFARNISHHPETWLDFPLSEEEDTDDFDMSDTQWNHATAVERLAPRLAALRIEFCPTHMSESYFWKVYFVLLHSRLNKHDADLLLTPQIVAARAMWMQELHKRTKPEPDWFGRSASHTKESNNSLQDDFGPTSSDFPSGNMSQRTYAFEPTTHYTTTNFDTQKVPVVSNENRFVDKSVIKEEGVIKTMEQLAGPSYKVPILDCDDDDDDDDDGDDWLKEDSDLDGYVGPAILVGTDEDVSFSDLEDDEDCTMPIKSKRVSKDLNL